MLSVSFQAHTEPPRGHHDDEHVDCLREVRLRDDVAGGDDNNDDDADEITTWQR